ncbi:hypothetical protein ACFL0G_00805 [Candidatus Zixiibacteriota bacterium]
MIRNKSCSRETAFIHVGSLGTYKFLSKLGEYNMFLAPLVQYDNSYAEYCRERSRESYTVLDSGALEIFIGTEKVDVNDERLLNMCIDLGVSEIVCPDWPMNAKESLVRSKSFVKSWRKLQDNLRPKLMFVPHGRTTKEWYSNAETLISEVSSCTIGIPRIFANMCKPEDPKFRISIAERLMLAFPKVDVHLLGAGMNFLEEIPFIRQSNRIRSIDSTFIHRYIVTDLNPLAEYAPPVPLKDTSVPNNSRVRAIAMQSILQQTNKDEKVDVS